MVKKGNKDVTCVESECIEDSHCDADRKCCKNRCGGMVCTKTGKETKNYSRYLLTLRRLPRKLEIILNIFSFSSSRSKSLFGKLVITFMQSILYKENVWYKHFKNRLYRQILRQTDSLWFNFMIHIVNSLSKIWVFFLLFQNFACPAKQSCKIQRVKCVMPECKDAYALNRPTCIPDSEATGRFSDIELFFCLLSLIYIFIINTLKIYECQNIWISLKLIYVNQV